MNMNKPPDETRKQGRNRSWLLVKQMTSNQTPSDGISTKEYAKISGKTVATITAQGQSTPVVGVGVSKIYIQYSRSSPPTSL